MGLHDEAIAAFAQAAALDPAYATPHQNLALVYIELGDSLQALAALDAALARNPTHAPSLTNRAGVLCTLGAFSEAERSAREALRLDPGAAMAATNLAMALQMQSRFAEAIEAGRQAVALDPESPEAHGNLGLAYLLQGDLREGWPEYAAMMRLRAHRYWFPYDARYPRWDGGPFAGRRLLVTREQGFGDMIMMARFLPAVKARGGTLLVESPAELCSFFRSLGCVDEVLEWRSEPVDPARFDLYLPIMGLAPLFAPALAALPPFEPYVRPAPERVQYWQRRFAGESRLRAGLVWAGNPEHNNDRNRSLSLAELAPLASCANVAFYSLQKGARAEEPPPPGLTLTALGAELHDFMETAAAVSALDLVIAVDTSIVHLAGAMGTPVWTLLAQVPDWRWLLERTDSPWYPSVRLFRQARGGDWAPVLAAIAAELAGGAQERPHTLPG